MYIENVKVMFKQMKNIDTAFRYIRLTTALVILGSFGLCSFVVYKSYRLMTFMESKIYVISGGKALEAMAADRKDNIAVEGRDHVKMFHHFFFSLDPDEKVIQENISRALYLADDRAKKQYETLKENAYYSNLIAGNISQQIKEDSILIDVTQYPYYFRYVGKQTIIRPTSISYRSLVSEGYLRNVARSDHNPHGFLIEKWTILENKDLKTENR